MSNHELLKDAISKYDPLIRNILNVGKHVVLYRVEGEGSQAWVNAVRYFRLVPDLRARLCFTVERRPAPGLSSF